MPDEKVKSLDKMTKDELIEYAKAQQVKNEELAVKLAEKEEDIPEPENQNPEKVRAWLEERVPFYAFKDDDKYKDDIVVGVNGKNFIIQRGKQVMIPRYVAMVIEESMVQDTHAANVMLGYQEQYNKRTQELGLA